MANPESASNPDENKTPEAESPAVAEDSAVAQERRDTAEAAAEDGEPAAVDSETASEEEKPEAPQDVADGAAAELPADSEVAEQPEPVVDEAPVASADPAAEPEAPAVADEAPAATVTEPPVVTATPAVVPPATGPLPPAPGPLPPQPFPPAVSPPAHTGAIPVMTGPPTGVFGPPVAPKSGLRQFRVLIGAGLAVVLVIAAALVFVFLGGFGGAGDAEAKVLAYYDALSRKDGKAAGRLVEDINREESGRYDSGTRELDSPFFDDSALKKGYRPPTDVEVIDSRTGPSQLVEQRENHEYATVTVAYAVGDHPGSDSFTLERKPDGDWKIVVAQLGWISTPEGAFEFEIAGVDTDDADDVEEFGSMYLPPGGYDLSITDSEIFEDLDTQIAVTPGSGNGFGSRQLISSVGLEPRAEVLEEIEDQVKEVVDDCAERGYYGGYNLTCDWETEDREPISSINHSTYDVTSYPEIDIVASLTGWGRVVTVEPAEATVSEPDTFSSDPELDEGDKVRMYPDGDITVVDGEPEWSGRD